MFLQQYGEKGPLLGTGTFGTVYQYGEFAIKEIEYNDSGISSSAINEIICLKSLKHPNVISFKDIIFGDNSIYFVMPLGISLIDYIRDIPRCKTIKIIHELCLGINYLHNHGIIHNDIKPHNCLMINGKTVISDFGLARDINYSDKLEIIQTINYRPPEILFGNILDEKYVFSADIWALGCTIFEIYTGEHLFIADDETQQLQQIFKLRNTWDELKNKLCNDHLFDLISLMLNIKYELRPPMTEVLRHSLFEDFPISNENFIYYQINDSIYPINVFNNNIRNVMIIWLIDIGYDQLLMDYIPMTIRLFDELCSKSLSISKLKLYALSCFAIASKLSIDAHISLNILSFLANNDFDISEISKTIKYVLKILDFNINVITPLTYFNSYKHDYSNQIQEGFKILCPFTYLDDLPEIYSNKERTLGLILYLCNLFKCPFRHSLNSKLLDFNNIFGEVLERNKIFYIERYIN